VTTARLKRCMDAEPALDELCLTLREVAGTGSRLLTVNRLGSGVYRIVMATRGPRLSVIAKLLKPPVAHRNQLALTKWLPAAGLEHAAPRLIGVAAKRAGWAVWHLYEDLGDLNLEHAAAKPAALEAAVQLIATIHARFAHDPVLPECRLWGEDHGIAFYDSSLRDAIAAVTAAIDGCGKRTRDADAGERLLDRLAGLKEEHEERADALALLGGPETLLHGDLWLKNAAIAPDLDRPRVRLIDWDHVGPGSFAYDLSTLVFRFPPHQRAEVIDLYRAAAAEHDMRLPSDEDLSSLFTTAECARLANIAIWPAVIAAEQGSRWAFQELAAIDQWLERVQTRCAA
jgi:hypothetical protein